ncbi:MAG: hypothetical protein ACKOW9_03605 [Candidatus Paceibacterota bacterium]
MDTKSQTLLVLLFLITFCTLGYTFYQTVLLQEFDVINTSEEAI